MKDKSIINDSKGQNKINAYPINTIALTNHVKVGKSKGAVNKLFAATKAAQSRGQGMVSVGEYSDTDEQDLQAELQQQYDLEDSRDSY